MEAEEAQGHDPVPPTTLGELHVPPTAPGRSSQTPGAHTRPLGPGPGAEAVEMQGPEGSLEEEDRLPGPQDGDGGELRAGTGGEEEEGLDAPAVPAMDGAQETTGTGRGADQTRLGATSEARGEAGEGISPATDEEVSPALATNGLARAELDSGPVNSSAEKPEGQEAGGQDEREVPALDSNPTPAWTGTPPPAPHEDGSSERVQLAGPKARAEGREGEDQRQEKVGNGEPGVEHQDQEEAVGWDPLEIQGEVGKEVEVEQGGGEPWWPLALEGQDPCQWGPGEGGERKASEESGLDGEGGTTGQLEPGKAEGQRVAEKQEPGQLDEESQRPTERREVEREERGEAEELWGQEEPGEGDERGNWETGGLGEPAGAREKGTEGEASWSLEERDWGQGSGLPSPDLGCPGAGSDGDPPWETHLPLSLAAGAAIFSDWAPAVVESEELPPAALGPGPERAPTGAPHPSARLPVPEAPASPSPPESPAGGPLPTPPWPLDSLDAADASAAIRTGQSPAALGAGTTGGALSDQDPALLVFGTSPDLGSPWPPGPLDGPGSRSGAEFSGSRRTVCSGPDWPEAQEPGHRGARAGTPALPSHTEPPGGIPQSSPRRLGSLRREGRGRPASLPTSSPPRGGPFDQPSCPAPPGAPGRPLPAPVVLRHHKPLPPLPTVERHSLPPTTERLDCLPAASPTSKRHSLPGNSAPTGSAVPRQNRPLPPTPPSDPYRDTPAGYPAPSRRNKPLPPTPAEDPPPPASAGPRHNKPLPPVPDAAEPPPLPPKAWRRDTRVQGECPDVEGTRVGTLRGSSGDWPASSPPSPGRTSWPPSEGCRRELLGGRGRRQSQESSGLAFSNITNFLMLGSTSPPPPGAPQPWGQPWGPGGTAGPGDGPQRSEGAPVWQARGSRHPPLEKASSWPHRKDHGKPGLGKLDPGKPPTSGRDHVETDVDGMGKSKNWNRQALRRPSLLPGQGEGTSPEKPPCNPNAVTLREKKPKENKASRRQSKLVYSSRQLYQDYSDDLLNKEIQSQKRLDSLTEEPETTSQRLLRRGLTSPESCLQRLSISTSDSLWQDIPCVRGSRILLSMTREDQKLQEAKFELIMSEASYLRSLHVAVDHFQLSTQLRSLLSNQDHQWLFSRLQDVRDVSTTFLTELEEKLEKNIFTFGVCDVVLKHAPEFRRVYLPYVTNQSYQERTFQSLLNTNGGFREALDKLESDPICQRLSLKSFLILPFQRITRLKLLLQNILKRTSPGSPEEEEATEAHHVIEELIRDCNSNVQSMRRTEELIYLNQKIEFECKIFPLISQSRWLVKSGEVTALETNLSPGVRKKLTTRPIHLHLFNDCLLLSRPREGSRFLVFDHAAFSDVRGEKCEMKLHGTHKNLFRLFLRRSNRGARTEFLFGTETQSEKLRWISALAPPKEELDLLECHNSQQVQCLRAYKPRENDELGLEKADVVMVMQHSSDGWLEGVRLSDGERGWFPVLHVENINNPEARQRNLQEAQRVKIAKLQLVGRQR
ncbi:rho guanine nucleotide exchange factor 5 [Ornithorhynchus anatinus]|uniref:rho guanine nucleotide exchange factor 5 n=1 Tax=Ornithorhynchus anatinus TaxID=9258 RepID=UPI0019D449D7|nr:rho guanine nucleotide exchange factor 5 [Ornithorhynchus anatinus]